MTNRDLPKRSIKKIAGDLYRFQNNFHFSVFFVTPDGIIATDPINKGAAQWLNHNLTHETITQTMTNLILNPEFGTTTGDGTNVIEKDKLKDLAYWLANAAPWNSEKTKRGVTAG